MLIILNHFILRLYRPDFSLVCIITVPKSSSRICWSSNTFRGGQENPYEEGLHIPVNPFYEWYFYDVRQKSHLEEANVPSQDQLQTKIQVSVQFKLSSKNAPKILRETGQDTDVLRVHINPKLRSLLQEQGKTIKRAEDFFMEETQQNMQILLLENLKDYLIPKGVNVGAVLIRDISLPPFIIKAVESKKEQEQEVERQKAK